MYGTVRYFLSVFFNKSTVLVLNAGLSALFSPAEILDELFWTVKWENGGKGCIVGYEYSMHTLPTL